MGSMAFVVQFHVNTASLVIVMEKLFVAPVPGSWLVRLQPAQTYWVEPSTTVASTWFVITVLRTYRCSPTKGVGSPWGETT